MLPVWDLTVPVATKRSRAISALVRPDAMSASTSSSRSLKGSSSRCAPRRGGAPSSSDPVSEGVESSSGLRGVGLDLSSVASAIGVAIPQTRTSHQRLVRGTRTRHIQPRTNTYNAACQFIHEVASRFTVEPRAPDSRFGAPGWPLCLSASSIRSLPAARGLAAGYGLSCVLRTRRRAVSRLKDGGARTLRGRVHWSWPWSVALRDGALEVLKG